MIPRVIFSDNTTLTDITVNANDYHSGEDSIAFTAAEDYLYIGSYFPFNHLYFKVGTVVNAETSTLSISYWDGTDFQSVAEVIDETASSGVTLAQSGFITFTPHKKYGWVKEDTVDASDNTRVTGLGNVKIYERYWIRIAVSANLTANTKLAWIGNLFTKDENDLEGTYPDLAASGTKTAFEAGKTDWEEQRVIAAKRIIRDLRKANIIKAASQILVREDFEEAEIHKVAEIVYNAFGEARAEERRKARKDYKNALQGFISEIDNNNNARSDDYERKESTSHGVR